MPRYKLTLEYDGRFFVGWQRQPTGFSVQETLQQAVYLFCRTETGVVGAGRTDAGVHALGQVAHVDLPKSYFARTVLHGLNYHLRALAGSRKIPYSPLTVLAVELVEDNFHARFSALKRAYVYRILNHQAPPALSYGFVWHFPRPLEVDLMQEAAQFLVGHHDFSTFRAHECQASSPLRTLDVLQVTRLGPSIEVRTKARSFLHHQVRNMVGTLTLVGSGKWHPVEVKKALQKADRRAGGPTAPADGLYFEQVFY